MSDPSPVGVGDFSPMKGGDTEDFFVDIAAELGSGVAISACAVSLVDEHGSLCAGAITRTNCGNGRVNFRVHAPTAPSASKVVCVFTLTDGEQKTKTAQLRIV